MGGFRHRGTLRLGGNAVIGVRFDSSEVGENLQEIVAYGTSVVVTAKRS